MRNALLLSFILAVGQASAQTPATAKPASTPQTKPAAPQTQPPPAQPQPAQPAPKPAAPAAPATPAQTPAPRRTPAATTARGGIAITTTSPQGATLPAVRVSLSGPTERSDETNASGQVTMPSLLVGTYRIRFEGDKVATFEKEIAVTAGKVTQVDVMLNPAPEPKVVTVAAPPSPTPSTQVGPKGQALTLGVVDVLEKEFVGRQARRESLLSCTGNLRTTMIQLNEPLPARSYDTADAMYYVLGGEGTISMDGRDTRLTTNGFASVPRGTPHSFTRRGNRALVLLAVLSGEPCEQAK